MENLLINFSSWYTNKLSEIIDREFSIIYVQGRHVIAVSHLTSCLSNHCHGVAWWPRARRRLAFIFAELAWKKQFFFYQMDNELKLLLCLTFTSSSILFQLSSASLCPCSKVSIIASPIFFPILIRIFVAPFTRFNNLFTQFFEHFRIVYELNQLDWFIKKCSEW